MVWVSLFGKLWFNRGSEPTRLPPRGADLNMFRKLPQWDVYPDKGCLWERSIISVSSAHWMIANVEIPCGGIAGASASIHPKHGKYRCRPTQHHHQAQSRWPSRKDHPGNVWTRSRKFHRRLRSQPTGPIGDIGQPWYRSWEHRSVPRWATNWRLKTEDQQLSSVGKDSGWCNFRWWKVVPNKWVLLVRVSTGDGWWWWWWWWWWWFLPHWYVYLHSIWGTFYGTCNWCKCR